MENFHKPMFNMDLSTDILQIFSQYKSLYVKSWQKDLLWVAKNAYFPDESIHKKRDVWEDVRKCYEYPLRKGKEQEENLFVILACIIVVSSAIKADNICWEEHFNGKWNNFLVKQFFRIPLT